VGCISRCPLDLGEADAELYSDIEQIWQMSWRKTFYRGGPVFMSALSGLDIALWDLKGALLVDIDK
jgi:L-alanine-DL-glutamate epimerase-like enolase superfamily enzyme